MQTDYLVPAVSQVDPQDTHAVKDKLHGSQEVIQHCRLPKKQSSEVRFINSHVHIVVFAEDLLVFVL